MRKHQIIVVLFSVITFAASAQRVYYPLNHQFSKIIEKQLNQKNVAFHTSIRPYVYQAVDSIAPIDTTFKQFYKKGLYLQGNTRLSRAALWVDRKLFSEHVITIEKEKFKVNINPIVDIGLGFDRPSELRTFQNSRGFLIEGQMGKKLQFNSSFVESQSSFLPYVNRRIDQSRVILNQGRRKVFKIDVGYDYAVAKGIVSYTPSKYFNFQAGQDHVFIGDGYRSLLLSDNAFSMPFFKITSTFWNIQYVNLYTQLNHFGMVSDLDGVPSKKYGAFHYLSWNIVDWLNVSLFEAIIQNSDGNTRGFDVHYLNPVIFLRPVEFNNGSADNVLLGMTTKIKIHDRAHLYGQAMIDELNIQNVKNGDGWWGNKFGFQTGMKAFDIMGIKNLSAQVEYNWVRPYTYTHFDSLANYSHFNEPIAHPLGANFTEGLAFLNYNYKRWFFEAKVSVAHVGLDEDTINWGNNIFLSYNTNRAKIDGEFGDYGHEILQGDYTEIINSDLKIAYLVNPKTNLRLEIGWSTRRQKLQGTEEVNDYVYFALKSALWNRYQDF